MADSLSDLIAQKDALEQQIRAAQRAAKAEAVATVRALMTEHGLDLSDIAAPLRKSGPNTGSKVAPKYRDPQSGATWSGRGLRPRWLFAALDAGKSLSDFTI